MKSSSVISVGIFFDGTGNNGVNALSPNKPQKNNESYYGAFTNMYRLYNIFKGDEKIYIEGIGTVTGTEDNNFAMATCSNPPYGSGYSSDDKIEKAKAFVDGIIRNNDNEYHFYLYGFGRGGMLARVFCNLLSFRYSEICSKIKFLGVFDTVESRPFNTYDLNLSEKIEHALHFCALHESRFFFPLTGFFENTKSIQDKKSEKQSTIWKELFVPGAHADVGGGYLEGPQSVYISTDFTNSKDLHNYVSDIRNTKTDSVGNRLWDTLLSGYHIEAENNFYQAYVCRDKVYNHLSKVYGKLMMEETNQMAMVFDAGLSELYFGFDDERHSSLNHFYTELSEYLKCFLTDKKPMYRYDQLADYIHLSSNFGLYSKALLKKTKNEINAELINNSLNVSSSISVDIENQTRLCVELHLPEDSFVADFLYGTSVPNNDLWIRSILKIPAIKLN
ncbi:T6SS phospholipase effector Tle1-like catalytic domain-containing protein [Chryseobacterium flavum]|uniref:T6SS phospholipase effector Tle1-like catalytic domain-containing protein n=1 Tax=Chryseobacterium flavum TaxID=415851 RepID=UPI0028AD6F78|nr:DUF2235 domain-containing protein [Chryseobacterium flavum]